MTETKPLCKTKVTPVDSPCNGGRFHFQYKSRILTGDRTRGDRSYTHDLLLNQYRVTNNLNMNDFLTPVDFFRL